MQLHFSSLHCTLSGKKVLLSTGRGSKIVNNTYYLELARVRQRELIDNQFFPLSAVVCPAWLRASCARFTKLGRQQLIEE